MKTIAPIKWMAVWTFVLAAATLPAMADQPAETAAAKPDKTYTGTVMTVDPKEHVLSVKSWALSEKSFNLGENCS